MRRGNFGVVRHIEIRVSVLRHFMQQKINNENSGTAGSRLQCSRLAGVTLHCSPLRIPHCDTAFRQILWPLVYNRRHSLLQANCKHWPLLILTKSAKLLLKIKTSGQRILTSVHIAGEGQIFHGGVNVTPASWDQCSRLHSDAGLVSWCRYWFLLCTPTQWLSAFQWAGKSPKAAPSPWSIRVPWAHPTHPPKQHLNPFSRFCKAQECDKQTDTQTDHTTPSVAIGRI